MNEYIVLVALRESLPGSAVMEALELVVNPCRVVQAKNCSQAIANAAEWSPQLTVLDTALPPIGGLQVAEKVWRLLPRTKILFISSGPPTEWYVQCLSSYKSEVHGYVSNVTPERLTFALQSLINFENSYVDPEYRRDRDSAPLTKRELQLVFDIAIGLTDRAIAHYRNMNLRTVQAQVSSLHEKILRSSTPIDSRQQNCVFNLRTKLVSECLQRGWITPDELSHHSNVFQSA